MTWNSAEAAPRLPSRYQNRYLARQPIAGRQARTARTAEGSLGMPEDSVSVLVALEADAGADDIERETLARQLRSELRHVDFDSISELSGQAAPTGAKAAELAEWGVWLVTLSASGGVLTSLISVAKDWLDRRGGGNRIKIIIGGDTIELDGASSAQQEALMKAFVRRHQTDRPPNTG